MKTSNKMLLGALIAVVIIIIASSGVMSYLIVNEKAGFKLMESPSIVLKRSMSRSSLDSLKRTLKKKNIKLMYDEIEFTNEGKIHAISGRIAYPGNSGSFSTDSLTRIELRPGFFGLEIK